MRYQIEKEVLEAEKREEANKRAKEPWRLFEDGGGWTQVRTKNKEQWSDYHDRLLKDIRESSAQMKNNLLLRIMFVGPVGAGKSSFINSFASIEHNGKIVAPMEAGSATESVTRRLRLYLTSTQLNTIVLMDTMGLEEQEESGLHIDDINFLVSGNIKPEYTFDTRRPIDESSSHFRKRPAFKDKAHCVVFVQSCSVIQSDSISDAARRKIEILIKNIRFKDVPVLLLLTNIDEICSVVKRDTSATYHSRAVDSCVQKAQEIYGLTKMNIFPVRNYTDEVQTNCHMDILILLAIRKMINVAIERIKCKADQDYDDRRKIRCVVM